MSELERASQGPEGGPSREEFLSFATELAEAIDGKGNVKRVGLVGSVARGKEQPRDLDMAIFIDPTSYETLMHSTERGQYSLISELNLHTINQLLRTGDGIQENFLFGEILGLTEDETDRVCDILVEEYPPVGDVKAWPHILILPNQFTPELGAQMILERDPTFISNIAEDYQEYDSQDQNFKPKSMFSEQDMAKIKAEEFERMKRLVADRDLPVSLDDMWRQMGEKNDKK